MTKRFVIFQRVIKCVRTASAIEEFLPVIEIRQLSYKYRETHISTLTKREELEHVMDIFLCFLRPNIK